MYFRLVFLQSSFIKYFSVRADFLNFSYRVNEYSRLLDGCRQDKKRECNSTEGGGGGSYLKGRSGETKSTILMQNDAFEAV